VTRPLPGFVNFTAEWLRNGRSLTKLERSVGFSVEKITAEDEPEDFRAFWQQLFDEASALPEQPRMIPLATDFPSEKNDLYELIVPTLNGKTLYGWLSIPKAEGKYPILVGYPGSGASAGIRHQFIYEDAISLFMEVHFYRPQPGESREETIARAGYDPFSYAVYGIDSRETFFYHDVLPGFHRALEFIEKLPQYNGKDIGFFGSSQGGWLSTMMAAFHPEVSAMFLNVPAFTQWNGFNSVRCHVARHKDDDPGYEKRARETLRYYSSVHAAKYTHAAVAMTVGRIDPVCPPASVYALYNRFPGKKVIYNEMDMRHECRDSWEEGVKALHDHLTGK
jgi:cephalosporin-C deacetylase-like acetyl esterase